MDLYATYTEAEIDSAAKRKLQIVNDYLTDLNTHLANIKRRILIDDNTLLSMIAALNAGFNVILYGPQEQQNLQYQVSYQWNFMEPGAMFTLRTVIGMSER